MPEKASTTHVLLENELIVYRRPRSRVWQCRYKVEGVWQRATTKQRDLTKAKAKAKELMLEAEIRRRSNLPFITRKFRHVAKLAIDRMTTEATAGRGKVSFADYERVINDYLIPYFGNYSITNVDHAALDEFGRWREEKMGKAPTQSTLMTQNAALNRVFDEAVARGFLSDVNRPKLEAKGKVSDRRPAFDLNEVHVMFASFDSWIANARNDKSRELRLLLRDYVEVLLDTGARPGDELLNLKWKQVKYSMKPVTIETGATYESDPNEPPDDPDDEYPVEVAARAPNRVVKSDMNRSCELTVKGKTGQRQTLGMNPTVKAFVRIIERNYGIKNNYVEPFKGVAVASNDDYVFRTKAKAKPTSFQNMFESFLAEHDLLIDPRTEQKRVFYSLRHTYATLALTHDQVPIHTLAKQMGTSVVMIEKHYSHLKVMQAIEQLRNRETRRLIAAGSVLEQPPKPKSASKAAAKKSKMASAETKRGSE
jgi:integrase